MPLTEMTTPGQGGGGNSDLGFIPWADLNGQTDYFVPLSYKAKRIVWYTGGNPANKTLYYYDETLNSSKFYGMQGAADLMAGANIGGATYWNGLKSVETNGFKLENFVSSYIDANSGIYWFASKD